MCSSPVQICICLPGRADPSVPHRAFAPFEQVWLKNTTISPPIMPFHLTVSLASRCLPHFSLIYSVVPEIPVTAVTTVTKPPVRPREAVCAGSTAGPVDKPHTWKNRHIRRLWACTKTHHATENRTGYRRREKTHLRVGPASRLSGHGAKPQPCQPHFAGRSPHPLLKERDEKRHHIQHPDRL